MIKLQKLEDLLNTTRAPLDRAVLDGDRIVTWGELEGLTRALVQRFAQSGYRRVAFLSHNRHELVSLFSAFSTLGIPFVGIDYTGPLGLMANCVRKLQPDCILYASELSAEAEELAAVAGVDALCIERDLPRVSEEGGRALPPIVPRPFESIAFTSGTTGLPKATLRTRSFDAKRFADLTVMFGFDDRDVFLATIPFYHVSVLGWARLFLSLGGVLAITDVSSAKAIAGDVRRHGVTAMLSSPTTLERTMAALATSPERTNLRFVMTGGRHTPRDLQRRAIDYFGPVVSGYYGTTETGVNAIATSEDILAFPGSAGRVLDGSHVVALDDDDAPVPPGESGRIAIHSYQNMDRYLNDNDAHLVEIDGRSYVVTADYGRVDGDRLYLGNRVFNADTTVDLYSIEDEIRLAEGVRDVFSVCVAERDVAVFVVATSTRAMPSFHERLACLRRRWRGFTLRAVFVDEIPYSMTGKVRVRELMQHVDRASSPIVARAQ